MKCEYQVGDVIRYRAFGDEERIVRVTAKEANIKNGQPGFGGVMVDATPVWGYDSQIIWPERMRGEQ